MKASITNFIKPVYRSSPSPAEIAGSFFDMKLEIFETEDGQQLKFYENDKGKLYIEISDGSGEQYYTGWIALDKQDAIDLSKSLMKVAKKLPEF